MLLRRMGTLLLGVPFAASLALAAPAAAGESKSDKAILAAGVIKNDDVPAGWTSKKSKASDSGFKGVSECKGIRSAVDSAKKKVPRVRSRDFEDPNSRGTTSAEDTVYVFKDANAASNFLAVFSGPEATTCLENSLSKQISNGGEPPALAPITDLQGVGDEAVGYEIAIGLPAGGQIMPLYIDFLAVRVGRAFLAFSFVNLSERIPNGPDIVNAVVQRVAAAQA
jgi:hypothetical protein